MSRKRRVDWIEGAVPVPATAPAAPADTWFASCGHLVAADITRTNGFAAVVTVVLGVGPQCRKCQKCRDCCRC